VFSWVLDGLEFLGEVVLEVREDFALDERRQVKLHDMGLCEAGDRAKRWALASTVTAIDATVDQKVIHKRFGHHHKPIAF
jgi:hypothetical protein